MKKLLLFLAIIALAELANATLLGMTGFETRTNLQENITASSIFSFSTATKKSGDYSLRLNATTTGAIWMQFGSYLTNGTTSTNINDANVYSKFQFFIVTAPADKNEIIYSVSTAASFVTTKIELRLNSNRTLAVYGETGMPLIATGTTILDLNKWYEIKVYSGTGTTAPIEVKIDNVVEISTTTSDPDQNNNNRVTLGKLLNYSGQTVDFYYDDLVFTNSEYPNSSQIIRMDADKNGSIVNWDDGNSTNFTAVNEIPNDGNLTVIGATDANTHYLGFETTASAGISGTINYVKENTFCRESVTATSAMTNRIKSGASTVSMSASRNLTNAFSVLQLTTTTDPATGTAWTTNALDAVEAGVVTTAAISTGTLYCTSVHLMVDFTTSGATTCTYSGNGNWLINLADNCNLTTDTNLLGNKFITYGTGSLILNAWFNTPEAHLIGSNIHWLGKGFK